MPVSEEQRKILLQRLELARKAKSEKKAVKLPLSNDLLPPLQPKSKPKPSKTQPPLESREVPDEIQPVQQLKPLPITKPSHVDIQEASPIHPPEKKDKKRFMKVVFYNEPPKRKVDRILKKVMEDDNESSESDDDEQLYQKQQPAKVEVAKRERKVPPPEDTELQQLARLYFS